MKNIPIRHSELPRQSGSALLTVMLTMVVLSVIAANMLLNLSSRHVVAHQAPHWHGAFNAAEAGADYAVAKLREGDTPDWSGWTSEAAGDPWQRTGQLVLDSSGGVATLFANVAIDRISPSDADPKKYFRVRSTGYSKMVNVKRRSGMDKRDGQLRKISMFFNRIDRTDIVDDHALVTRRVEAIAKEGTPSYFPRAILADWKIELDALNYFDSYDSDDPEHSMTIGGLSGQYNPATFLKNGDVATNHNEKWDIAKATIMGDALANGAPEITQTQNVSGEARTDFHSPIAPVPTPTGFTSMAKPPKNAVTTLAGGTKAFPTRRKISDVLELDAGGKLLLRNPVVGGVPGPESWVELWVTGEIKVASGGVIESERGVHVKIFFESKLELKGDDGVPNKGMYNGTGRPAYFLFYGLSVGTMQDVILDDLNFNAALYAPNHKVKFDMKLKDAFGAFVCRELDIDKTSRLHYDEALGRLDTDGDGNYGFISWVENVR